jgi:MFS family permease
MTRWISETFAALAVRDFRVLWISTVLAFLAFFMSTVVNSVVAFGLTGNNTTVGFVVFGQGAAMFFLGPIGGAYADRWSKRRTIATAQLVTTMVFFCLAALMAAGAMHVAYLAAGSFVMGAMFAFLGPTRQAFVVEVVGSELRGNAIALSQVANNLSRALGPAAAGALLAWPVVGSTGAYGVMGVLYSCAVVAVLQMPSSPGRADAAQTHVLQDVMAGLRYVGGHARLRTLMLLFMLVVMLGMPHITLMPGLMENQLGHPAESISLLFGISAAAAFVTSVLVARQADAARAVPIFVAMGFGFGLSLLVLAWVPSFGAAVGAMVAVGVTTGGFQTLSGAVVVRETEPQYVGRVMAVTLMAFGGFGLVGLPVGYLGDQIGERATLSVLGVVVCSVVSVAGAVLARQARNRS